MPYNQHNVPGPEYRVRPVVRWVLTRYCHPYVHEEENGAFGVSGGSAVVAEFENETQAEEIARILQAEEKRQHEAMLAAPGSPTQATPFPVVSGSGCG